MSSSTSSAPSYILTRLLRVDQALTEASRKSFGASARVYHAMQEIDQQSDRIIDRGQTLSRRDQEDRDAMLRSIEYAIDLEQNQAKAYDERKGIRQKWEQSLAATVMADHHRTLASHLDESQPSHWTVSDVAALREAVEASIRTLNNIFDRNAEVDVEDEMTMDALADALVQMSEAHRGRRRTGMSALDIAWNFSTFAERLRGIAERQT